MLPAQLPNTLEPKKVLGTAVCPGAALTVRVTVALAVLAEAKALCAVTVTMFVDGLDGAVYKPAGEIVPTEEFPPAMPPTNQFTAVFVVPETVAVNCCD